MNKLPQNLSILILAAALCLSGCARTHEFWWKSTPMSRSEFKKALKKDWGEKRQADEVKNQEWGTCAQRIEPESACSRQRDPKFAVYKLEVFYSDGGPMDVSKALYCPQENQYWIDETAGNAPIKCRLLGPFSLGKGSPKKHSK